MRGSGNALLTLLVLAVLFMGAYLVFNVPRTEIIQQAMPTAPAEKEMKTVAFWDIVVSVIDDGEQPRPVADAAVYLLYEKPSNIYKAPAQEDIYKYLEVNAVDEPRIAGVLAGRKYFVLATAPGYYNAGKEVEVPKQMPKEDNPQDDPIVVEIAMSKVGTLKVWPTSDEYMGSTTDKVKLVDKGDGVYVTEFEIRETADGEFRYKKISIETLDDGVSFSEVRIYLGDEELESDGGSIRFDEERKFNKGDAVPVKVEVVDFQNANDVAEPLKIVFHSVQDNVSDFEIVIEKPA